MGGVSLEQQTEDHHGLYYIGTFTASDNGYIGSIKTLTLNIKACLCRASDKRKRQGASTTASSPVPIEPAPPGEEDRLARPDREIPLELEARRSDLPGPDLRLFAEGRRRRGLALIWSRRSSD